MRELALVAAEAALEEDRRVRGAPYDPTYTRKLTAFLDRSAASNDIGEVIFWWRSGVLGSDVGHQISDVKAAISRASDKLRTGQETPAAVRDLCVTISKRASAWAPPLFHPCF